MGNSFTKLVKRIFISSFKNSIERIFNLNSLNAEKLGRTMSQLREMKDWTLSCLDNFRIPSVYKKVPGFGYISMSRKKRAVKQCVLAKTSTAESLQPHSAMTLRAHSLSMLPKNWEIPKNMLPKALRDGSNTPACWEGILYVNILAQILRQSEVNGWRPSWIYHINEEGNSFFSITWRYVKQNIIFGMAPNNLQIDA